MEGSFDPSSDGQSASSFSKRLPVNPRRHKVAPEQRKRVVRACNACNNRRVKCTGEQPCERCIRTSRECEYTASETDRASIKDELERLRARCAVLEEGVLTIAPQQAPELLRRLNRGELPDWAHVVSSSPGSPATVLSDDGEGRMLHDPDGGVRYLGESSGATFLDQLKRFIRTLTGSLALVPGSEDGSSFVDSIGSYQTYDSRPLPNPIVDPHWLPSQSEMRQMLGALRHYIQDGDGTFRSGGIHWWGNLKDPPVAPASPTSFDRTAINDSDRHLAFYNACFALSVLLRQPYLQLPDYQSGQAYFKRARVLLGNPLDTVHFTLDDVPALSLMGFYLIEVNRRDTAYMYVSLAVHTAIIHGSFRHTVDEASKRIFWTLYILDRWISMLMGRPPIIPDEAIRLPLPTADPSLPPCIGLRANIELAKISGYIVRETYRIAPGSSKNTGPQNAINEALRMLQDWHTQLPAELELQHSPEQPLLDPACCTLHMGYNQLIILTTRPVFFSAIKKVVAQRILSRESSPEVTVHEKHARSCTEAAQRNLKLARLLQSANGTWLQSGLHFLFNAAVILLLNRIYSAHRDTVQADPAFEGRYSAEIGFAIGIFEQEAKTGTNYPQDCCRVLQGLKALTDRYVIMERRPNLQQWSIVRELPASVSNTSPSSQQSPPQGSDHFHSVYESLKTWASTDDLHPQDSLHM